MSVWLCTPLIKFKFLQVPNYSTFNKLIRVDVWIKAVMAFGNWKRNPSICLSLGSVLLQRRRGGESTITLICGSIKLLMRNNFSALNMNLWGFTCIFLGWALLLDVGEQTADEYKHISAKCLTWESWYNLHDDMQNYSVGEEITGNTQKSKKIRICCVNDVALWIRFGQLGRQYWNLTSAITGG